VRACVHACVQVCVRACVQVCVRACVNGLVGKWVCVWAVGHCGWVCTAGGVNKCFTSNLNVCNKAFMHYKRRCIIQISIRVNDV